MCLLLQRSDLMEDGQVDQFLDIGSLGAFEDPGFQRGNGTDAEVESFGDLVGAPSL